MGMDFIDVVNLDNTTYNPPINSHGETITGLPGWTQVIHTEYRSMNDPSATISGTSDLVFVEVQVTHNGDTCLTTGWLVARKE
jgi:hypothetical protein